MRYCVVCCLRVLRRRHSGFGRGSRVARNVAHRRNRNGLRDSCCARTKPEGLRCKVGSHLVLRLEQARDSSVPFEHKHGRRNHRRGIADETRGSRHRQLVDVRAALRLPDSEGVGGCQRLVCLLPNIGAARVAMRQLYEGVRSRVMYGAPVWVDDLLASRRSILLLRRLHRVTAIRIVRGYRTVSPMRVDDRFGRVFPVGASGIGAQKEIYPHESVGPGRGFNRTRETT